ncbi:MAG TPA: SPOR domain-containing protein [Myxococcota bacterium]|jgi:DedD protein
MGRRARRSRGWLFSVLGLALVAIPGFALGLFAGVLWEDPGLILGDLAGDTDEVAWGPQAAPADTGAAPTEAAPAGDEAAAAGAPPDVAAAPPAPPPVLPTADRAANPTARAAGGKLSVQVGAFGESHAAEQLADSLRKSGLPVYVSPSAAAAGEQRWRVRVGPLATREEADRIASRLKAKEKLPTWVLTEDGT